MSFISQYFIVASNDPHWMDRLFLLFSFIWKVIYCLKEIIWPKMSRNEASRKELELYRQKIKRWNMLGFETSGMEKLLEENFSAFKKRKLKMLSGQIGVDKDNNVSPVLKPLADVTDKSSIIEEKRDAEALVLIGDPDKKFHDNVETQSDRSLKEEKARDMDEVDEGLILVGEPQAGKQQKESPTDSIILLDNQESLEDTEHYNYYVIEPEKPEIDIIETGDVAEIKKDKNGKKGEKDGKEEGGKKVKRGRGKKYRGVEEKKKRRDTLIALGVSAMLLVIGIFILDPGLMKDIFTTNGNDEPDNIVITIVAPEEGKTFSAGTQIDFEARVDGVSDGKIEHTEWTFGDGSVSSNKATTHRYVTSVNKTYIIRFTTQVDGKTFNESINIHITRAKVVVAEKKGGQHVSYDVTSTMSMEDEKGIESFSQSGNEILLTRLDVEGEGPQTIDLDISESSIEDGFLLDHETYSRKVHIQQDLMGNATLLYKNQFGETREDSGIVGSFELRDDIYTDLSSDRPIKEVVDSSLTLTSELNKDSSYRVTDKVVNYHDITSPYIDIDVTTIRENRTFLLGDAEPGGMENLHYMWSVTDVESIQGVIALKINIKLDPDILELYGITHHQINLWVANGYAFPVKFQLEVEQVQEGTYSTLGFQGVMVTQEYQFGTMPIEEMECKYGYNDTHHHIERWDWKDDTMEGSFARMEIVPASGNITGDMTDFTLEDAFAIIQQEDAYQEYLAKHPNAFGVDVRFNKTDTMYLWNITFGEKDEKAKNDGIRYHISSDGGISVWEDIEVEKINSYHFELAEVVDIQGALFILHQQEYIEESFFTGTGKYGEKLNFGETILGASTHLPSMTWETIYIGSKSNPDMGFFLQNKIENENTANMELAVMNAHTGQILYYLEHSEESPDFDISNFL